MRGVQADRYGGVFFLLQCWYRGSAAKKEDFFDEDRTYEPIANRSNY